MFKKTDELLLRDLKVKINKCPKCHGTNLACTCYQAYYHALAVIKANIPAKYRDFTLSDIDQPESQKSVKKVTQYMDRLQNNRKKGIGLYLYGNPGTAKTVLGCIVMMNSLRRKYTCYFTNADHYLELSVTKKDEPEAREIVKYLSNVDFLMIDDLGREYRDKGGFVEAHLDELIRYRADNLLPTLITTNKPQTELAQNNYRLLSLFHEHFLTIPFTTKDYRPRIGAKLKNA